MTDIIRKKRPMTAKAMAEKYGVSQRTVQRIFAEPREQYLSHSISRAKPWDALGMSRATWYRKGKPNPTHIEAETDSGNKK